jgi:hypothetical protein
MNATKRAVLFIHVGVQGCTGHTIVSKTVCCVLSVHCGEATSSVNDVRDVDLRLHGSLLNAVS